jgi:hypothetical protein
MIELIAVALCCLGTVVTAFGMIWLSVQHIRLERRVARLEWVVRGRLWSLAAGGSSSGQGARSGGLCERVAEVGRDDGGLSAVQRAVDRRDDHLPLVTHPLHRGVPLQPQAVDRDGNTAQPFAWRDPAAMLKP